MKSKSYYRIVRFFLIILIMVVSGVTQAQLLSGEEAKIDSVIMEVIEKQLVVPSESDIKESRWIYSDDLGNRDLTFSANMKFKMKNEGAMGKYANRKGTWYIYDRYIVLEVKKEKFPLYYISYNGKTLLLDQESIDVMRKLIMGFSTKDQLIVGLTDETIFGFLNGFERSDK